MGYLIYLEIIELRFCGLNKNLKREISERGKNEIYNFDDSGNIDDSLGLNDFSYTEQDEDNEDDDIISQVEMKKI